MIKLSREAKIMLRWFVIIAILRWIVFIFTTIKQAIMAPFTNLFVPSKEKTKKEIIIMEDYKINKKTKINRRKLLIGEFVNQYENTFNSCAIFPRAGASEFMIFEDVNKITDLLELSYLIRRVTDVTLYFGALIRLRRRYPDMVKVVHKEQKEFYVNVLSIKGINTERKNGHIEINIGDEFTYDYKEKNIDDIEDIFNYAQLAKQKAKYRYNKLAKSVALERCDESYDDFLHYNSFLSDNVFTTICGD